MSFEISRYGAWFRIFGYGLHVRPSGHPMLFSERNGYTKTWLLLGLRFKVLTP